MKLLDRLRKLFTKTEIQDAPHTQAAQEASPELQYSTWLPTPPPIHPERTTPAKPQAQPVQAFICAVVGESHQNPDGKSRQAIIREHARPGQQAKLKREPDNPYDANAVAVFVNGHQIGYLKRDVAARLCDWIDDPAYEAIASVHSIHGGTREKPSRGVTLELKVLETGMPSINALVDGTPTYELLSSHKDDLEMMLRCCGAEEAAFKARPYGRRYAPAPAAFLRAAILSRKAKDYAAEVKICERWLTLANEYQSQPIVIAEGWAIITEGQAHKNISARLEKARAKAFKK